MNFTEITDQFDASVPGTDAFLKVKEGMHRLISEDSGRAAAYFLIYGFARSYVILHDDEGISTDFAERAKTQLLHYMRQIETSLQNDATTLLEAMNKIVSDYETARQAF